MKFLKSHKILFLAFIIAAGGLMYSWKNIYCLGWAGMHGVCTPMRADFVESHPPEEMTETVPSPPDNTPNAWYWAKGHWDYYEYVSNYKTGKWIWTQGSWVKRVLTHDEYIALGESEQWEPEHWERVSGGWARRGGHSSTLTDYSEQRYAEKPPPDDKTEVQPPIPNDNKNFPPESWYWANGQWYWINGEYQWAAGQWMVKPDGFYRWVPARWEEHYRKDWRGWLLLRGFIEYKTPDGRITTDCCSWENKH